MSKESYDFAYEMYGMEDTLQKKDTSLWDEWETKTGKLWRELNYAEDWDEAFRNNPEICNDFKWALKSLL